jgi:cytochrome b involved in lipid metabolism
VSVRVLTRAVQVLDVTQFMLEHPGGKRVIMM